MARSKGSPARRTLGARVRELRRRKGWTLEELSASCGVSRSMLSQIERDRANPTVAVAQRIGRTFGMTVGALVDVPADGAVIEVVRGRDRQTLYRSEGGCRIRTLSPLHREKDVEFYELRLGAGQALRSAAHFAGTRELLTVVTGRVRVTSGEQSAELGPGDSAHFPADVPHSIQNAGSGPAVAFLVDVYRGG